MDGDFHQGIYVVIISTDLRMALSDLTQSYQRRISRVVTSKYNNQVSTENIIATTYIFFVFGVNMATVAQQRGNPSHNRQV